MDKEQAQFKTEGDPAFPVEDKENANSSVSPTDKTNTDQTPSPAGEEKAGENKHGSDNFADHPRWQEREKNWTERFNSQEQRHTDELTQLREEIDQRFTPKDDSLPEIPAWFGGDESQWKEFIEWNRLLVSDAEENAYNRLTSEQKAQRDKIGEATQYFNDQVKTLESDAALNPKGEKIDRNKLLKFVLDNDLVDSKGRWNYRAGFMGMKSTGIPITRNVNEKK